MYFRSSTQREICEGGTCVMTICVSHILMKLFSRNVLWRFHLFTLKTALLESLKCFTLERKCFSTPDGVQVIFLLPNLIFNRRTKIDVFNLSLGIRLFFRSFTYIVRMGGWTAHKRVLQISLNSNITRSMLWAKQIS